MKTMMLLILFANMAMAGKIGYAPITSMRFDFPLTWEVQAVNIVLNDSRKVSSISVEKKGELFYVKEEYIKRLSESSFLNGCYLTFEKWDGIQISVYLILASRNVQKTYKLVIDSEGNVNERFSIFP